MDEKKMVHGIDDMDFNVWDEMLDPDFVKMGEIIALKPRWRSYHKGIEGIEDSIIKPVNNYVRNLIAPPELINDSGEIRLRYNSHADFWLRVRDDDSLWHVDRPWQRQYYHTSFQPKVDTSLVFEPTFIFYTPWFIDLTLEVEYQNIDDSPFLVHNKKDMWHKIMPTSEFVHPHYVPFNFKKVGSHMREEDFGIIKQPAPMFDMVLPDNDIIRERVRKFYAEYQILSF